MARIRYDTLQAADTRSRELWVHILGGPKLLENVTEYLYSRSVDPETGEVTLDIPERDGYLDKLLREDRMTAAEVSALVALYPAWASGRNYALGDLCTYGGKLYKVVQAHTSQADWTPNVVPALFVGVAPAGVIPAWVQPLGAHDAYALGAQVTHRGQVWRSTISANVWEPGVFGWILN